jgi:acyl-CoA synthetase (AMP-forming)/AMP-acid ligase II
LPSYKTIGESIVERRSLRNIHIRQAICPFWILRTNAHAGSTGRPKGVDVSHRNVTNALLLEPARLGITIGSRVAQVLNIAFDMGMHALQPDARMSDDCVGAWELLGCLMNGGTLYMRGLDWNATLSEVR